ncbi:MAG: ABC transporter permease [Trueperaceae bacterium]|nr:ABC transporter permease [Trueperaceae bacterium]MCW5820783.1 ABC transporter permease [Trueperaceae bacterium]
MSAGSPVAGRTGARGAGAWLTPLVVLAVLLAAAGLLGLWRSWWWAILGAGFVLVVLAAEGASRRLPFRLQTPFERALAWLFPLLVLAAWEWLSTSGVLNPRWFPPPSRIVGALWDLTVNYDRFSGTSLIGRPWVIPSRLAEQGWPGVAALFDESHVWATLSRVIIGFVLGAVPALLVGMVMGLNRTVRTMLDSTMSAIYVLPKIAIFPILMLVFPDPFGEGPKVTVVAISAFFLVALSTMAGVQGIDKVLLQAGSNFGANRWQMLRHVILPGALPIVFNGLRLALGTALIVIVAVEFVRAKTGVGYLVYYHWQVLGTPKMYAALVVVMVLGVGLTALLQLVERLVMPWRR